MLWLRLTSSLSANVLLSVCKAEVIDQLLRWVTQPTTFQFPKRDFKADLLKTQLTIFASNFSGYVQDGRFVILTDVVQYFKRLSEAEN